MTTTGAADLLVVEDEPALRAVVSRSLTFAGYSVRTVGTIAQARAAIAERPPDLALLDRMLPDGSGFDLGGTLRSAHPEVAVMFLTAKDSIDDRLTGFALGGDDYLPKPFSVAELVARVSAVLRRSRPGAVAETELRVADLVLRVDAHEIHRGDRRIELSPTEYRLLHVLMSNPGRVLSKQQLLQQVWEYDFRGDAGVVEKCISQLRRKIDEEGPPLVHTVRGFGYVLRSA